MSESLDELFKKIGTGDQNAFREVYERWYAPLYNMALAYTKLEELADDVIQQVFLKIWERREILPGVEDARAWLFTTARFQAFQVLKKEMKQDGYEQKAAEKLYGAKVITPEESLIVADMERVIHQSLETLTDKQRHAYTLSRYEGLTYKQIAALWNVGVPTIKEHVTKAAKVVQQALEQFRDRKLLLLISLQIFFL